jgi:L-iditol 2-dehydrogenase
MRACALVAPRRLELIDVAPLPLGPHDVRVRPAAVGVCGTDLHVFAGESNFHLDRKGRAIPLELSPQILGHEITGTVVERGRDVHDVPLGTRVVVDQGRSCRSERREPACEYCASGDSHQCAHYREHGISGLPGGFAEELVVPDTNVLPIDERVPFADAALTEPLACVLHCLARAQRTGCRYGFGPGAAQRVRTAVVLGGGPAGLLFVQVLRHVVGFAGPLVVSEPAAAKRSLARGFGAEAVAPEDLADAVRERSGGRGADLVVEATGSARAFAMLPATICKQATVLLYGLGHGDGPVSLQGLQWREACLVTSVGASGGFDADGRPSIYRDAAALLGSRRVHAAPLVTHRFAGLAAVPDAFAGVHREPGYVKGIVELG